MMKTRQLRGGKGIGAIEFGSEPSSTGTLLCASLPIFVTYPRFYDGYGVSSDVTAGLFFFVQFSNRSLISFIHLAPTQKEVGA